MMPKPSDANEFDRIVYVNTRSTPPGVLPDDIGSVRDWMWSRTGTLRWQILESDAIQRAHARARLFVMDWSRRNSDSARPAFQSIRAIKAEIPILFVDSGTGKAAGRVKDGSRQRLLSSADLQDHEKVSSTFQALGITLSEAALDVRLDSRDINIRTLLQAVPEERIRLTISKYFPGATTADLMPAAGGLSGAPIRSAV